MNNKVRFLVFSILFSLVFKAFAVPAKDYEQLAATGNIYEIESAFDSQKKLYSQVFGSERASFLMLCLKNDRASSIIKKCTEKGCKIKYKDANKKSVFMYACESCTSVNTVEDLLKKLAMTKSAKQRLLLEKDKTGLNAFDYAKKNRSSEIYKMLLQYGKDPNFEKESNEESSKVTTTDINSQHNETKDSTFESEIESAEPESVSSEPDSSEPEESTPEIEETTDLFFREETLEETVSEEDGDEDSAEDDDIDTDSVEDTVSIDTEPADMEEENPDLNDSVPYFLPEETVSDTETAPENCETPTVTPESTVIEDMDTTTTALQSETSDTNGDLDSLTETEMTQAVYDITEETVQAESTEAHFADTGEKPIDISEQDDLSANANFVSSAANSEEDISSFDINLGIPSSTTGYFPLLKEKNVETLKDNISLERIHQDFIEYSENTTHENEISDSENTELSEYIFENDFEPEDESISLDENSPDEIVTDIFEIEYPARTNGYYSPLSEENIDSLKNNISLDKIDQFNSVKHDLA